MHLYFRVLTYWKPFQQNSLFYNIMVKYVISLLRRVLVSRLNTLASSIGSIQIDCNHQFICVLPPNFLGNSRLSISIELVLARVWARANKRASALDACPLPQVSRSAVYLWQRQRSLFIPCKWETKTCFCFHFLRFCVPSQEATLQ